MATASPTYKYLLTQNLLGEPLRAYVERKRAEGKAWRLICMDLLADTGGQIDVTQQTLRNWFPDMPGELEAAS